MLKKTISRIVLIVFFMAAKQSYACELNRPVKFAGLDWDSAQFVMEIARVIIEKGYGCPTEALPGSTLPMLSGLIRGDIDVLPEVWKEDIKEAWHKAEKSGAVKTLGIAFRGAKQGFYVPKYVIDGDKSRNIKPMAPNLKSVYDLHKYSQVFKDREEPSKGRFYNCIIGWSCEKVNNQKLKAYSLDNYYNNFHPGTSASLSAAIESAYLQGEPILFYYWEPTWIMGKYDLYKLKEPAYTHEKWKTLESESKQFPEGCAYPLVDVYTGVSTNFIKEAPELVAFLEKFELTSKLISKYLAFIKENEAGHREAALQFLKNEKKLWHTWVPEKVAESINLKETKATKFPEILQVNIAVPINKFMENLVTKYGRSFDTISDFILKGLLIVEIFLRDLPWWLFLILACSIVALLTRRVSYTLAIFSAFMGIGALGLWDLAMQTLALMLVATTLAIAIGIPIGVMMAYSWTLRKIVTPLLDMMQTMPSFVYLIPALMLFGLGKVPALFATLIYSTPPLIRLTDLGIRLVDHNVLEAAEAFGVSFRYRLFGIQLPLAMPNILAGINQTMMMALSMVVIASMIGARGLGEQVLIGIQRLDVGKGAEAGIAIVILAITLDRITQFIGKSDYTSKKSN